MIERWEALNKGWKVIIGFWVGCIILAWLTYLFGLIPLCILIVFAATFGLSGRIYEAAMGIHYPKPPG